MMSILDFFSDEQHDCGQTEEYLESVANHLERVLKKEFGIDVHGSLGDTTEKVIRLLNCAVFALSIQDGNPNVDGDCVRERGSVISDRVPKWTSSSSVPPDPEENPLFMCAGKILYEDETYLKKWERVAAFGLKHWGGEGETYLGFSKLSDAESLLLREADAHDREKGWKSWLPEVISLREAKLYAIEVANRVGHKLSQRRDEIDPRASDLSQGEQAVVGTYYLALLSHLPEEGIHQSTAVLELRKSLAASLSNEAHLRVAETFILLDLSDRDEATIKSWALCHHEGKEFYPSERRSHVPRNVVRFEKLVTGALDFAKSVEVEMIS